ncbi:hypothetical protein SynROS8604_01695 [Synechococcus sp. ROS8604]|nr:hypothetical protein SynROS8604_01695 [Synechococcus sp. ROS8604]
MLLDWQLISDQHHTSFLHFGVQPLKQNDATNNNLSTKNVRAWI